MYTIGDIPRKWAKLNPNKESIICYSHGETRITWKELNERVFRLASSLLKMGLQKGDHIAIFMDNNHQYMELYYAMAVTGIIPIPLNTRLNKNEIKYIIQNSQAIGIVIEPKYENVLNSIKPGLKEIQYYISAVEKIEGMKFYEDLIKEGLPEDPEIGIDEKDTFFICYTGGTTGLPKGVMLSHRNMMNWFIDAVLCAYNEPNIRFTQDDSTLLVLPAFHISVWPAFLFNFMGAKVILIDKASDIDLILKTMEKEKVAHMNAVPTIYFLIVHHPELDRYDLSHLKWLSYAGAAFPTEILKKCIDKFGPIFSQGLGATEGGPWSVLYTHDHISGESLDQNKRLRSAGRETFLCEMKIVNEQGNELEAGEIGELIVKTKSTMIGYWNNPEKTEEVIKNGWYWTGDLGFIEDNYLYLVDRKNDTIKSGGEKVYPFEVENILYKHPIVEEAIVIGLSDPKWGQIVHAAIKLKREYWDKSKYNPEELQNELKDFCHQYLAPYKCPKSFEFWKKSLPKSAIGKLLRKEIRKKYEEVKA